MNSLNPAQLQSVLTQTNIIVSELYSLRQRVAELEAENRNLAAKVEQGKEQQGASPNKLEGERQ